MPHHYNDQYGPPSPPVDPRYFGQSGGSQDATQQAVQGSAQNLMSFVPPLALVYGGLRALGAGNTPVGLITDKAPPVQLAPGTFEGWDEAKWQATLNDPNFANLPGGVKQQVMSQYNIWKTQQRASQYEGMENQANAYRDKLREASDPSRVNNIHNIVMENIRRAQGAAVGGAGAVAGAHTTNMLNPLQGIMAARTQAGQPYVGALSQNEAGRARNLYQQQQDALSGEMNYFQMLNLINRAKQGDMEAADKLALMQQQLALENRRLDAQIDAQTADWTDYVSAGAQVLPYLFLA